MRLSRLGNFKPNFDEKGNYSTMSIHCFQHLIIGGKLEFFQSAFLGFGGFYGFQFRISALVTMGFFQFFIFIATASRFEFVGCRVCQYCQTALDAFVPSFYATPTTLRWLGTPIRRQIHPGSMYWYSDQKLHKMSPRFDHTAMDFYKIPLESDGRPNKVSTLSPMEMITVSTSRVRL